MVVSTGVTIIWLLSTVYVDAPKRLRCVAHGIFRVVPTEAWESTEQVVPALCFVLELADDVVIEARDEDWSSRCVSWVKLRACT